MVYQCKYFKIEELVHPVTFKKYGAGAWRFLNEDILRGLDTCRELFGPLTVNNWHTGGNFVDSGYRQSDSDTGSLWSSHRRGCAFDPKSKIHTGEQMRDIIKAGIAGKLEENKSKLVSKLLVCINEIELDTSTWLHIAHTNRAELAWIPYK